MKRAAVACTSRQSESAFKQILDGRSFVCGSWLRIRGAGLNHEIGERSLREDSNSRSNGMRSTHRRSNMAGN